MTEQANIKRNEKWLFLKKWPLYVLLLPVFFVIHGVRENFGFILPADYLPLIGLYCVAAIILFAVFYPFYKKRNKAGISSLLVMSVFFFYGFIQDFLKENLPVVNRYIILLPFFLLLLFIAFVLVKKSKNSFKQTSFFLNSLLLIYTVYDLSAIVIKTASPPADKFSVYPFAQNKQYKTCDTCSKPDIYFLVFDEYASSLNLKNNFGFDNQQLDSFLIHKQFQIQKHSFSNYNFTPFSVASILNMSYIDGITPERITSDDYAACNKLIRENEVCKYFSATGYDIVNYSIFDIAGNPAPVNQDFLPLKARLITDRTLWGRVKKDLFWNLLTGKFQVKWLAEDQVYLYKQNNNKLIELVKSEADKKAAKPRFIYAHYNMPHPPYYYDKDGNEIEKLKLSHEYDGDKNLYLGYVQYSNSKIKELVNAILTNSNGQAVIIIMGDHGFRNDKTIKQEVFFQNQNAVYIPGKNYRQLYDSISAVNQFKVVINTLFNQSIPLSKDSTVFLKDVQ